MINDEASGWFLYQRQASSATYNYLHKNPKAQFYTNSKFAVIYPMESIFAATKFKPVDQIKFGLKDFEENYN